MHPICRLAIAIALAIPAHAQCSSLTNTPSGTDLDLGDDDVRTVGLPFAFAFQGQNYTTLSIAANGFVWLGTVTPAQLLNVAGDYFDNEDDLLQWGPRIAACWDDWNPASPQLQPGGGVFFRADATSASIVWKGVPAFTLGGPPTVFANMEVVLTAAGQIFVHYAPTMGVSSDDSIVGITAGNGAAANAIAWSTFVPGTVFGGTAYELVAAGTFALAGQTLQFTPLQAAGIDHVVTAGALATCPPTTPEPLASTPVPFGSGCPTFAGTNLSSIQEVFTPDGGLNPDDLSNHSITFQRAGSIYVATQGPGFDASYLTHGRILPQEDETVATGLSVGPMGTFPFCSLSVAAIDAAANGYLLLQPAPQSQWLPSAADLVAGPARIAPHWSDYDLFFQGTFYWSNDDPSFCMATWENVEAFADPGSSNTFQCKLWANGDITFSYGLVHSQFDDVLVGFSLGHGATDPGDIDMSSAPANTFFRDLGTAVLPMVHTASGPASILTPFTLRATDLPPGTVLGVFAVGSVPQNVDLTALGMPGCASYVSLDQLYYAFAQNATLQQTFAIPALPQLLGMAVHSQAAAFAPVNAFGLATSNALSITIGR